MKEGHLNVQYMNDHLNVEFVQQLKYTESECTKCTIIYSYENLRNLNFFFLNQSPGIV